MTQKRIYLTIFAFVLLMASGGCRMNPTGNSTVNTVKDKGSTISPTINPSDVEQITNTGGVPGRKSKVLFPQKDSEKIAKIVGLINSTSKRESTSEDTNFLNGRHGYPLILTIKLKDGNIIEVQKIMKITQKQVPNGIEQTRTDDKDKVLLSTENNGNRNYITLLSAEMAEYIAKGSTVDMPSVTPFSINPETIKPGEKVTISGDGNTGKEVSIYITDGTSNEKYLMGKVPVNDGAWKWEGTINGRNIRTLDGKETRLSRDRYLFEATLEGGTIAGGTIDFSSIK
jgi:hypothetical protein